MTTIQVMEQSVESEESTWLSIFAMADGVVVGSCKVTGWTSDCPCIAYLFVSAEKRGKGIGGMIVERSLVEARGAGKLALSLTVNKKNDGAERLYRRLGFRTFADDEKNRWMSVLLNQ